MIYEHKFVWQPDCDVWEHDDSGEAWCQSLDRYFRIPSGSDFVSCLSTEPVQGAYRCVVASSRFRSVGWECRVYNDADEEVLSYGVWDLFLSVCNETLPEPLPPERASLCTPLLKEPVTLWWWIEL